ncbi:hypothetical protein [Nitrosopumilus maritimus]|uniref:hypothetical protein n=1 Tax=Nitrosopumilus maritimus TaxID=338192 RepID=UPI001930F27C|nr:hypothetical protein [Nitrosopumilus maritimus]
MRLIFHIFLILGTILISFQTFFVSEAYAYLDPSTGSMFIHVIIGALVGVGITLKVYWLKIKFKLSNMMKKE